MRTPNDLMRTFLEELMTRRNRLPSQLAADLGISHATVGRWLNNQDVPCTKSCRKLSEYSGVPLETILAFADHIPKNGERIQFKWPEQPSPTRVGKGSE